MRTLSLIAVLCLLAAPVLAQEAQESGTPTLPQDIALTVAAGAKVAPKYSGSSDYEAIFAPAVDFQYKQRAFLVIDRQAMMVPYEGLGYKFLGNQDFSLGANLTYDAGREAMGDLRGMNDIDWTALGGVFAAYHPGRFFIRGQVGYDLLGEFDGYKGELGTGIVAPLNPNLRGMVELDTGFAGDGYTEKFYGVSGAQSAATGGRLAGYNANPGFYRFGLSGTLRYQLTQGAFVQGLARWDQLIGDAADSSVTTDDAQFTLGGHVGYKF